MLVSAKEMLNKARDGKYAVGQFNIKNLLFGKARFIRSVRASPDHKILLITAVRILFSFR